MMIPLSLVFCLSLLCVLLAASHGQTEPDNHASCAQWAAAGECNKNPNYMLANCQVSCSKVSKANDIPPAASFYDIVETDLNGNEFKFDVFKNRVVYIINVASHCGYTEENYRVFRNLKKYEPEGLVMVLAPCNSFGFQEPGDAVAIKAFAMKQEFKGLILSKADVNGQDTRPAFRYLKHATQRQLISWNFDGKFLVDRSGNVHTTNNDTIEEQIQEMLRQPSAEL